MNETGTGKGLVRAVLVPVMALLAVMAGGCSTLGSSSGAWGHRVLASGDQSARDLREEGLLTYRGRLVPSTFGSIVCPLGTFVYRHPHVLVSASSGWLREAETTSGDIASRAGVMFTVADAERGWYDAPFSGRKERTPPDWVWVRIVTNGFWLKPQGLFFYSELLAPPKEGAR